MSCHVFWQSLWKHATTAIIGFNVHTLMDRAIAFTPLQNWLKWNLCVFKKGMVYMNLEGRWSLTTPLMGLSHTRYYYEIFSPKFMTFFKQKDYLEIYLENIHPYHFYLLISTGSNYFLAPWGSLGIHLSSQGTPRVHNLTQKQFQQLPFNLPVNINYFLMTQNQFDFFAQLIG